MIYAQLIFCLSRVAYESNKLIIKFLVSVSKFLVLDMDFTANFLIKKLYASSPINNAVFVILESFNNSLNSIVVPFIYSFAIL